MPTKKKKRSIREIAGDYIKDALKGPGSRTVKRESLLKRAVSTAAKEQSDRIDKEMRRDEGRARMKKYPARPTGRKRTPDEIARIDADNTRKGKLYKSIVNPKKKNK